MTSSLWHFLSVLTYMVESINDPKLSLELNLLPSFLASGLSVLGTFYSLHLYLETLSHYP